MTVSRRSMLKMAAGASLMPWAPGLNVAFAADTTSPRNVLVYIFLRFGMDGLMLLAPSDTGDFRDKRRNIAIGTTGVNAGRNIGALDGVPMFLHPDAEQLRLMYNAGKLAFIHASGIPTGLRSHFEVQEMVDKGAADTEILSNTGWLTRHLNARIGPASEFLSTADSLIGTTPLRSTGGIVQTTELKALQYYLDTERTELMRVLNKGNTPSAQSVRKTLQMAEVVKSKLSTLPRTENPNYIYGNLSQKLQPLARALKLNIGLEVAAVDLGGWDHRDFIRFNFSNAVEELSNALFAFTDDLGPDLMSRVTIIAQTEFGRRVEENANAGTDHGAASVMLAMGAGITGGKIYGAWPGLKDKDLDGGDLAVTTDSRQVLAEVLTKRMGQPAVGNVFPALAYKPLGLVTS